MTEQQRKELVDYRFQKARETLQEVAVMRENELWNLVINRLYYSCYYAVSALLVNNGYNSKTHAGAGQLFQQHFVRTGLIKVELGKFFSEIFDKRHKGDYEDFIDYTEEDVVQLIPLASELIAAIGAMLPT